MKNIIYTTLIAIGLLFLPAILIFLCWLVSFGYFNLVDTYTSEAYANISIGWFTLAVSSWFIAKITD